MKPLRYLTALIIFLTIVQGAEAKSKAKLHYLEMIGTLQQDMNVEKAGLNYLDSAQVTIYDRATRETSTSYSDATGTWSFKLPLNRYYILKISKKGFVTKTITVNTGVPKNRVDDYVLPFDVFMFEKINDIDVSVLNNPIAKVIFDGHCNYFVYNYSYTDMINEKLKKLYAYYYAHRTKPDNGNLTMPPITIANVVTLTDIKPAETNLPDIEFHVQLLATRSPRDLSSPFFASFVKVGENKLNGLYKYTIGDFKSLAQAQALKIAIRGMGFSDAFIVADKEKERIPVPQAIAELKR